MTPEILHLAYLLPSNLRLPLATNSVLILQIVTLCPHAVHAMQMMNTMATMIPGPTVPEKCAPSGLLLLTVLTPLQLADLKDDQSWWIPTNIRRTEQLVDALVLIHRSASSRLRRLTIRPMTTVVLMAVT